MALQRSSPAALVFVLYVVLLGAAIVWAVRSPWPGLVAPLEVVGLAVVLLRRAARGEREKAQEETARLREGRPATAEQRFAARRDAGSARVFYRPAGSALKRAVAPSDLPDDGRFPECSVAFDYYEDLPDLDENFGMSLDGHAEPVQDSMELECQLVTHGIYCGDPSGYSDPRAEALAADSGAWRLLRNSTRTTMPT